MTYKVAQADVSEAAKDALHKVADEGDKAGLTVSVGGTAVKEKATTGPTELIGIAVAAVVLVITFGSLAAGGLPLLTAIFGVAMAMLSITIATHLWNLSSSAPTLALMLGLAVAIDYALFIVSLYRNELKDGQDPEEAVGRALGTAGSAVVFAGLTVIIALAGLSVIGVRMMTDIGLSAAFAVAIAVLIALTLLPAMLGFAGKRITKGRLKTGRMRRLERGEGESMGVRWGRFVTRTSSPTAGAAPWPNCAVCSTSSARTTRSRRPPRSRHSRAWPTSTPCWRGSGTPVPPPPCTWRATSPASVRDSNSPSTASSRKP